MGLLNFYWNIGEFEDQSALAITELARCLCKLNTRSETTTCLCIFMFCPFTNRQKVVKSIIVV